MFEPSIQLDGFFVIVTFMCFLHYEIRKKSCVGSAVMMGCCGVNFYFFMEKFAKLIGG